ncbi:MAG TPA: GGDEF domain-containing protein [Dehalococcoidia bacterium]
MPNGTGLRSSERDLMREEASISRLAWAGGAAVTIVTVAAFVALWVEVGGQWWHFALYSTAAGVPFAYALFCIVVIRRMQLSAYHRFKARLVMELTDLQDLVYRDELTGLFNRRHFYEVLKIEVEKARLSRQPLAILMMDLDGLKTINDEYGHGIGDEVLANLGKAVARHTRTHDVAARLGGDEFGVVMPETDKRGAFALARRLWDDLERTPMYQEGDKSIVVTISVGLAGYPWGGEEVEDLIQWADADMYANKVSRKLAKSGDTMTQPVASGGIDSAPEDEYGNS